MAFEDIGSACRYVDAALFQSVDEKTVVNEYIVRLQAAHATLLATRRADQIRSVHGPPAE